jgi:Bacteriophage minor capsid protein
LLLDEAAAYLATVTPSLGTYVPSGVLPPGDAPVILKGSMPASPSRVLVVRPYGGPPSDLGFGVDGIQFEYPGLQMVSRGEPNDYVEPLQRLERAYQAGAKVQARTLSGTYHLLWSPQQPPFPLDKDENGRFIFVCNFIVQKEPSAA